MSTHPPPPAGSSDERGWEHASTPGTPPAAGAPSAGWSSPPTSWGPATGGYAAYPLPATAGWPLASWGQRVLAWLVDSLVALPFVLVGVLALTVTLVAASDGSDPSVLGLSITVLSYLVGIAFVVWNLVVRQGRTGQSIGKSVLGIRVARESDGTPQGALMSLVRMVLHSAIDGALCYLGYLWPLWDDKRQTFTDKILSTVVVDVKAGAPAA